MTDDRDGFIVCDEDGEEVHFVPCASSIQRDRVLIGMLRNMNPAYFVKDTRDDTGAPTDG